MQQLLSFGFYLWKNTTFSFILDAKNTLRICEIKNEKKFNKKPRNSNHELLLLQMLVEKSINCNTSRSSRWAGGQSATSFKICKMNQFEIRKIHKFVAALDISTQQKHFRWSSVNCCVIYDIYLLREWVWKETLLLILSFFFLFFPENCLLWS